MNFKKGDIVLNLTDFQKTILVDDKYGRGSFFAAISFVVIDADDKDFIIAPRHKSKLFDNTIDWNETFRIFVFKQSTAKSILNPNSILYNFSNDEFGIKERLKTLKNKLPKIDNEDDNFFQSLDCLKQAILDNISQIH